MSRKLLIHKMNIRFTMSHYVQYMLHLSYKFTSIMISYEVWVNLGACLQHFLVGISGYTWRPICHWSDQWIFHWMDFNDFFTNQVWSWMFLLRRMKLFMSNASVFNARRKAWNLITALYLHMLLLWLQLIRNVVSLKKKQKTKKQ